MPDQSIADKSRRDRNFAIPDMGSWLTSYSQAFENWSQSGNGWMKKAAEFSEEIMTFSRTLLQADIEAWQSAASCKTPVEFFECQRAFAEKATQAYLEEASKIMTRFMSMAGEASTAFSRERAAQP